MRRGTPACSSARVRWELLPERVMISCYRQGGFPEDDEMKNKEPAPKDFAIVGTGAFAGGLGSLNEELPTANTGLRSKVDEWKHSNDTYKTWRTATALSDFLGRWPADQMRHIISHSDRRAASD